MVLPLFLFSIFKNLKETNKIDIKKNFKKNIHKNHALEKLSSPLIHKKKEKKVLWLRWGLNPQTSDPKSSALPTELSGMH